MTVGQADGGMVPPGRLELPPPASEAGALSTELQGRSPWSIADITIVNGLPGA